MRRLRRAHQRHARQKKKFKRRAVAAGTAAVITLGAGASLNKALAHIPDPHELPVSQDADADLLADAEELAIGYRPFNLDQNRNEIPDGVELAKRCSAVIDQLPEFVYSAPPGIQETYKIIFLLDGTGICEICGFPAYMDYWEIVNPRLGLTVRVSVMAAHYMEHGSFSYQGDGRADVARLLRILDLRYPYDPNEHQLPPDANDLDGDLLTDTEELAAYYNLYDPDQNQNLNPDGIELANQCAEVIDALPLHNPQSGNPPPKQTYKIEHLARGIETCDICAEIFNMGFLEIVNPQSQLTINIPIISVHYMSHGSFSYAGSTNTGRVDIPLLVKLLEMPRRCGHLGIIYLPADLNKDCQENAADFAEMANKWLESTDPNSD